MREPLWPCNFTQNFFNDHTVTQVMSVNMVRMGVTVLWGRSVVEEGKFSFHLLLKFILFLSIQLKNKYGDAFIRGNNGKLTVTLCVITVYWEIFLYFSTT